MATSAPKKPSEMTFAEALTAAIDGPQPTAARPAKGHPMYPSEPARPDKRHPMYPEDDDEEIPESNLADFSGEPPKRYALADLRKGLYVIDPPQQPAGDQEPEIPEDSGFAAAIEAALSRTRDVTERAKATVGASRAATDAQARMEKIGQEAASYQRTAAVENAAEKGFAAAGSPLESPAEIADNAAEKRFSEAEAEIAFKAPVVPEVDEATVLKDFETTHGGTFDPNSSADADKMERIKKARARNPKATPTQLALMIYRNQV